MFGYTANAWWHASTIDVVSKPIYNLHFKFYANICSPTLKNQLVTGHWSVILISNNGDGEPIAYERDFNLTVGTQKTATFTPTVTVSVTSTPVVNVTCSSLCISYVLDMSCWRIEATVIDVASNTTLPAVTTTVPATTIVPTKILTPSRVTSTSTKTLFTIYKVRPTVQIIKSTVIVTPSCTIPPRQPTHDPTCRIKPTVGAASIQQIAISAVPALATAPAKLASVKFRRTERGVEFDKELFLRERHERMAANKLVKRAPDQATLTVTDTNTADYTT